MSTPQCLVDDAATFAFLTFPGKKHHTTRTQTVANDTRHKDTNLKYFMLQLQVNRINHQ